MACWSEHLSAAVSLEAVQLSRTVRNVGLDLVQVLEDVHGQNLFPEIPPVELHAQDRLIHRLELPEGEFGWQQIESHMTVQDGGTEPLKTGVEDLLVIEGKGTNVGDGMPVEFMCMGLQLATVDVYQGIIGDGDHPARRVPARLAEGMHLLQIYVGKTRPAAEHPVGGLVGILVYTHQVTEQRPLVLVFVEVASDQQHLELMVVKPENHAVDGKGQLEVAVYLDRMDINVHRRLLGHKEGIR